MYYKIASQKSTACQNETFKPEHSVSTYSPKVPKTLCKHLVLRAPCVTINHLDKRIPKYARHLQLHTTSLCKIKPKMKETALGCGGVKFVELTNNIQTTYDDSVTDGQKHGRLRKAVH